MKTETNILKTAAALLLLPFLTLGNKTDTLKKNVEHVIEISTAVTVKGNPAGEYQLLLSTEGKFLDTLYVEKARPVYFDLDQNNLYALVFKKEGFPDRVVMIDTHIPAGIKKSQYYTIDFDLEIDTETSTQKKELIDYPAAIIRYDSRVKDFEYSRKYNQQVHETKFILLADNYRR